MDPIKILLVDDHPIFRDGLRRLLESEPGFHIVGEAGTGAEAVRLIAQQPPDILLLDLMLPDMSGLEVLRAVGAQAPSVRTILLTAAIDRPETLEALQLGARGLVLKTSATALLHRCVRQVMAGEYWFGHDHLSDVVKAMQELAAGPTPVEKLTKRELDIISAVVNGATNRDISRQFGVSEQTVKNHLSNIFDKVGVSNRLELALYVTHHKLLGRRKS